MSSTKTSFGKKIFDLTVMNLLKAVSPLLNLHIIPFRWASIGKIISVHQKNDCIIFECDNGFLEIKAVTESIWRIRGSKKPLLTEHHSWAAIEPKNNLKLKIHQEKDYYVIKEDKRVSGKDDVILKIDCKNPTITMENVDGRIFCSEKNAIAFSKMGQWARCEKISPKKVLHCGFGERTGKLVKNGKKMIFWNTDPSTYGRFDDPLYQSEPIQISVGTDGLAFGIFYDNFHYSVIKSKKNNRSSINYYTEMEPICYYIFTGPKIKDVCLQITSLNGRLPLPPRWVLGHHQSRWSYYSEEKVREIANNFRRRKIPCDCIHFDIDYMEGYRCFTWSKERFPNPKKLTSDLLLDGFKITAITDPGLKVDSNWNIYNECIQKELHCKLPNGQSYIDKVWPGKCVFPDFLKNETSKWWGEQFSALINSRIEGYWLDMGEPSTFTPLRTAPNKVQHNLNGSIVDHKEYHNLYGHSMAKATRIGLDKLRNGLRTFIFVRSCYAGIQRFGASWSGDNYSKWYSLRQSIPMIMSMGLTGQPLVGSDVGGFTGNTNPELLTRWYQVGVFYPFCRNHSTNGTINQEPWAFGKETESIIKKYIELRYQLLPYFYYYLMIASFNGLPIMRPLFMEFPKDANAYSEKWHNSEFMIGEKILVAPVISKGKTKNHRLFLPKGKWIDFWTNETIDGDRIITKNISIDQLPLFVKAGSVIPKSHIVEHVEKTVDYPLYLDIYPGEEIQGNAYYDDGYTKNFEKNEYALLSIVGKDNKKQIIFDIIKNGQLDNFPTTNNTIQINILNRQKPNAIKINDKVLPNKTGASENCWEYITKENKIIIYIKDYQFPLTAQVQF